MRLHLVHNKDAFTGPGDPWGDPGDTTLVFTDAMTEEKALDLGRVGAVLLGLTGTYATPCITVTGSSVVGSPITSDGEELILVGIIVWAEFGGPSGAKLREFLDTRLKTWDTYLRLNGMSRDDVTFESTTSYPGGDTTDGGYDGWSQGEKNPAIRLIEAINSFDSVSVEF